MIHDWENDEVRDFSMSMAVVAMVVLESDTGLQ